MLKRIKEQFGVILVALLVSIFIVYHIFSWFQVPVFLQALSHPVQTDKGQAQVKQQIANGSNQAPLQTLTDPVRITIPAVHIDLGVVASHQISPTEWPIATTAANFAVGTTLPNMIAGNTVIFGHDTDAVFHAIHEIQNGDNITVYTTDHIYTYIVTHTKVVPPTDVAIMDPTADPELTLFTCDGWLSQNRFAVFTKLISTRSLITDTILSQSK